MNRWQQFKAWLMAWEAQQARKWEERQIVQYRRQLWAAADKINAAKRRLEQAQNQ